MKIEIREVVASYVLTISDNVVQARITKCINESEVFLWDISHHSVEEGSRTKKPAPAPAKTIKDALQQIMDYAKFHNPGYSPKKNIDY